jgi:PleD family two-component response regulator
LRLKPFWKYFCSLPLIWGTPDDQNSTHDRRRPRPYLPSATGEPPGRRYAYADAMKKALVVEDDPDIVELIDHYLRAEGFEVESLGDGRQALERLRAGGHDVVILDLQLPGLDGLSPARCPSSCSPRGATRPTAW